jgi:hypothetical protein
VNEVEGESSKIKDVQGRRRNEGGGKGGRNLGAADERRT